MSQHANENLLSVLAYSLASPRLLVASTAAVLVRAAHTSMSMSLSLFLLCGVVGAVVGSGIPASAENLQTYQNDRAGYMIAYPDNWYQSPPFYANAFEIRNYDAAHRVPEKDEASIITTQEGPVTPEQGQRRIRELVSAASTGKSFHLEQLPVGEQVLYQWTVLERPAIPAGHPSQERPLAPDKMRLRVASAVVLGSQIVRMEGKTWEDADPQVIAAMKAITRSIKPLTKEGGAK